MHFVEKITVSPLELATYYDKAEKAGETIVELTHIKTATSKDVYLVVKKKTHVVPAVTGKFLTTMDPVPNLEKPVLPKAGGVFTDPFFGTKVLRVSDEGDCGTAYSYWSTFNENNTKILIQDYKGLGYIKEFNPVTLELGARTDIIGFATTEDAVWGAKNSDVLFGHNSRAQILAFNVVTKSNSIVGDLVKFFPAGYYFWQMSVSRDDDVFAFNLKDGNYQDAGYAVWKRSINQFLWRSDIYANEVQIDKSGKFLAVRTGDQGAGKIEAQIINLETKIVTNLIDDVDQAPGGHSDMGFGTTVGDANWNNGITIRNLSNPKDFINIINFGSDWSMDKHISFLANDEKWCLVSTFKGSGKPLNNEIFFVATDGSGKVRRFLSHYSAYDDYQDSPRANISRDGKFVAYTMECGFSNRSLFIAKVPEL